MNATRKDDNIHIQCSGFIDEDTVFPSLDLKGCNGITVDWQGAKGINSCGIREWLRWTEKLPNSVKLVFLNCPRIVVNQISMVKGFLPDTAVVQSLFVPYYCDHCDSVTSVLFRQGVEFNSDTINPPSAVVCGKCGANTEIDVVPSKYFRFAKGPV